MSDPNPLTQLDPLSPLESAMLDQIPWKPVDPDTAGVVIAYGDPDDPF